MVEELRKMNQSLEQMDKKIDSLEKEEKKPGFIIWDLIRSLLIGVVIVGPAIAVAIIVIQVLYSWLFA